MRIGIDARFYSSAFTGIGRYVYELIENLLKLDRRNTYVLFLNQTGFDQFQSTAKNVEKILVNALHYSFDEQWKFWRMLRKAKLNLMHFTHFNAPILYRKPCIVTIHDLTLNLFPGKKMDNWFRRFSYRVTLNSIVKRAKKIIAVSQYTRNDILRFLRADIEKIEVIHEGVSSQFHPIFDQHIISNFLKQIGLTKPYILYTGVWRSHKNLVNLIKAFAILKHTHHFPGRLVITGKEDPWYPEVKQTVVDEHLENFVRFTGFVPDEDLVLLYNGASIYVLPSLYEGFGLPALEAFACGIPVCAANTSSLTEVCGQDNAVFFDPHSPADMASKIASVYNDGEKMRQLKERGLKRIKDFSWQKMASETLKIYHEITD